MVTLLDVPIDVLRLFVKDLDACSYMCTKMACKRLNTIFPQQKVGKYSDSRKHVIFCAIASKRLNVVRWLLSFRPKLLTPDLTKDAACVGFKHFFRWLDEENELRDVVYKNIERNGLTSVLAEAARSGNLELVKWFKSRNHKIFRYEIAAAAESGSLKLFEWVWYRHDEKQVWSWTDLLRGAAIGSHSNLDIVNWIRQYSIVNPSLHIPISVLWYYAIIYSKPLLVRWLHQHSYPLRSDYIDSVFSNPAYEILAFLIKHYSDQTLQYQVRDNVFREIAKQGKMDCLQLILGAGFRPETGGWSEVASSNGHLNILQYMRSQGYELSSSCMYWAINCENKDIVDWLIVDVNIRPDDHELRMMSSKASFSDVIANLLDNSKSTLDNRLSVVSDMYGNAAEYKNMHLILTLLMHDYPLPVYIPQFRDGFTSCFNVESSDYLTNDMKAILLLCENNRIILNSFKQAHNTIVLQYMRENTKSRYL